MRMDDPTQSDVVGTASAPVVVAAVVVVGISVGETETGFLVVVGGSTMVVPLPRCDEVSPPVWTGGRR